MRCMNTICNRLITGASVLLVLVLTCEISIGSEFERVNRYSLHTLTAKPSQTDLLSAVVDTRFPPSVKTVGTALDYILHRSGYRHVATSDISQALELPLPQTHRSIGPLDVRTAVRTIVGDSWQLHEDSRQRILWFQRAGVDTEEIVVSPATGKMATDRQNSNGVPSTPETTPSELWTLDTSLTLRENIESWAKSVDWSVEWRSQHDYFITHAATFPGELKDAVRAVLMHYRDAPVPLLGKFYSGNSVLVIESSNSSKFRAP